MHEYAELCAIYFKNPSAAFYNPAYKSGVMSDLAAGTASAHEHPQRICFEHTSTATPRPGTNG